MLQAPSRSLIKESENTCKVKLLTKEMFARIKKNTKDKYYRFSTAELKNIAFVSHIYDNWSSLL